MNSAFIILHVLYICEKCIHGYDRHTTYRYETERTSISRIANRTRVTVGYNSSQRISLTHHELDQYLNLNITKQFLSQYPHEYQRDVLRKQLKHCPYTGLCGFSFNLTQNRSSCCLDCSCNISSCVEYKTCCPDILFTYVNKLSPSSDIQDLPKLIGQQTAQKNCIPLHLSKTITYNSLGAYGFTSCSFNLEEELQAKCSREYEIEDISEVEEIIPVIDKKTNELYRNKYCAFCNNVSINNIRQLNSSLECSGHTDLTSEKGILNAVAHDICIFTFFEESSELESCYITKHDCIITQTLEETVCNLYISPIFTNKILYQNIFCSYCNVNRNTSFTCSIKSTPFFGYSLSGLMNIDQTDANNDAEVCKNFQLKDDLLGVCKDMWCSGITILENGQCVDRLEELGNVSYTAFVRIKPINVLMISDAVEAVDQVGRFLMKLLENAEMCDFKVLIKTNVTFVMPYANVICIDALVRYHVTKSHDPDSIVTKLFKIHNLKRSFLLDNTNKLLTLSFKLVDGAQDFLQPLDSFSAFVALSSPPENMQRVLNYSQTSHCNFILTNLYILELTKCPKVSISISDVPWERFEDEIFFIDGSFKLTRFEYFLPHKDHIMVCTDIYKKYMSFILKANQRNSDLSLETVISISFIALSILSLCVTLFFYCFLSEIRQSIAGKNILSLVTSLLCAQCLYLIDNFAALEEYSTACFVLGLFVHLSWLFALLWMNICTFHMFRVLLKTRVISGSSGIKRILFYHIYAFSVATIFVSLNVGISYITNGDYGYGGDACYISSQRMLIFTFGIPASMIVLSNLFMFLKVVIKIKGSPSVKKNVKNERNDIIIFAKLSTITGATWIFGLIYMFIKSIVLSYIFIVLNGSQGIFIMFSFIINRRVFNLLKGKVVRLKVSMTSGSKQTTFHTM